MPNHHFWWSTSRPPVYSHYRPSTAIKPPFLMGLNGITHMVKLFNHAKQRHKTHGKLPAPWTSWGTTYDVSSAAACSGNSCSATLGGGRAGWTGSSAMLSLAGALELIFFIFHRLGISSSQLTKIFQSGGSTTNQISMEVWMGKSPLDIGYIFFNGSSMMDMNEYKWIMLAIQMR